MHVSPEPPHPAGLESPGWSGRLSTSGSIGLGMTVPKTRLRWGGPAEEQALPSARIHRVVDVLGPPLMCRTVPVMGERQTGDTCVLLMRSSSSARSDHPGTRPWKLSSGLALSRDRAFSNSVFRAAPLGPTHHLTSGSPDRSGAGHRPLSAYPSPPPSAGGAYTGMPRRFKSSRGPATRHLQRRGHSHSPSVAHT